MPSLRFELATIARLSLPPVLAQLGMTMLGAVDTLLLGHVGVNELAAAALGNVWEWTWLCLGLGLVTGIEPLISQAHGREDGPGTALALQRGIVIALIVSVPICVSLTLTEAGLKALGQDPEVAQLAGRYNLYKLPTIPCFLIFAALRQYLQGRALMAPATWVMWIGIGLHVVLSSTLIFGRFGLPALGIEGAAIAESTTFVLLVIGLSLWMRAFRLHAGAWRPWSRDSVAWRGLLQVVRLGWPIAMQIAFEAWAFSIAAIMAGWIDRDAVSTHQIALNLAVVSFMIPLGISQGAATRVGNLIGAGDAHEMRHAVRASLLLGASVMFIPALAFTLLREQLPRLYSDDPGVVAFAADLLPVAAAFQLFDGVQVVAGAVLRGMGRPHAGALLSLLGYYVIALPLAYLVGFVWGLGLMGIWVSLAVGIVSVATALLVLLRRAVRRPIWALQLGIERSLSDQPSASHVLPSSSASPSVT